MKAIELVTKAIREGVKYVDDNTCYHRRHFESEDIENMSKSLSAGLIVMTEERLEEVVGESFEHGVIYADNHHPEDDPGCEWEIYQDQYASRIMQEVNGGE